MLNVDEQKFLVAQNNGLRAQNETLQKENYEIKKTFTKLFAEIYKICNEPADNIGICEIQERMKSVVDKFVSKVL